MRLEASGLTCVRGGREVFSGLGFAVAGGEALLVTGRNGAGKSSLLRMVAGLLRIAGGHLAMAGADPEKNHPGAGPLPRPPGRAEALPDGCRKPRILGPLSGRRRSRREPALAAVGLGRAGRSAGRLPVGRPAAAAVPRPALAVKRPIWLLDEPTSALDREAQDTLARPDAAAPRRRRADRRGGARPDRARRRQGAAARETPHEPARWRLFIRDVRLAIRVGGGGGIGVLFFLIVVVLMPFAIGPDLALLGRHRAGDPVAWRAARSVC